MKTILIRGGKQAIVDDEDFASLSCNKWCISAGYAMRCIGSSETGGKPYYVGMHREIMGLQKGDRRVVDHINGDKLDNRRANLRICTKSQNAMNRAATSKNPTGLKGVTLCKSSGRWRAMIRVDGSKPEHLGYFDTPEDAHAAYVVASKRLHDEFSPYRQQVAAVQTLGVELVEV